MEEKLSENDDKIKFEEPINLDKNFSLKTNPFKRIPLITCTKMNKYFLFPFIAAFFISIREIMINSIIYYNQDINFNLVMMITVNSFFFIVGIIYFIIDYKGYRERQKTKSAIKKDSKRKIAVKEISRLKLFFILLLMALIFPPYILISFFSITHVVIEKRQYIIFMIVFLNKILLKKQFLRHHIFSLIISFIGFLILSTLTILRIPSEDIKFNIYSFFGSMLYTLTFGLVEFLHKKYEIEIYFIYIILGFFGLIFSFLIFIIYSEIKNGDLSYLDEEALYFFKHKIENKYYIFYSILVLIGIGAEFFAALTIHYFTFVHFFISSFIAVIIGYIENNIEMKKDKDYDFITHLIVYAVELFGLLVYNEIIVINKWGLNINTVKGINEREKEEVDTLQNIEQFNKNKDRKEKYDIEDYYVDDNEDSWEIYDYKIEMGKKL